MRRAGLPFFALLLTATSAAAQTSEALQASYDTYAGPLDVAKVDVGLGISPGGYRVHLAYHTTGLVGFFFRGHQVNDVTGSWSADQPAPQEFSGIGEWRGEERVTLIDYTAGEPIIRRLVPPQLSEREPVPPKLQEHSVDTLSALALLLHRVAQTGRCEAAVHTYDGRRATAIEAHTVQLETLKPTSRSIFAGTALRCDFVGQMLAGFRLSDDDPADRKPLHGSAWLAVMTPGAPPIPVRMSFETHWFGDAVMYLTGLGGGAGARIAAH